MRAFTRIILVAAVAVMVFSLPAVADNGTDGDNGGFVCFPFICN